MDAETVRSGERRRGRWREQCDVTWRLRDDFALPSAVSTRTVTDRSPDPADGSNLHSSQARVDHHTTDYHVHEFAGTTAQFVYLLLPYVKKPTYICVDYKYKHTIKLVINASSFVVTATATVLVVCSSFLFFFFSLPLYLVICSRYIVIIMSDTGDQFNYRSAPLV